MKRGKDLYDIVESDDMRVIDRLEDVDLRQKTLLKLLAKPIHDDLLDCNLRPSDPMLGMPYPRERSRSYLSSEHIVPNHSGSSGSATVPGHR